MCRLLLTLLAVALVSQNAWCQQDEQYAAEDNIVEGDNESPADEPDDVPIEGSGAQGFQESALNAAPLIEEAEPTTTEPAGEEAIACPVDLCTCSHESDGDAVKLTVDCSSKGLKELPAGIDNRVNVLFQQRNSYNELLELPKSIAGFKDLEELNVNNNSITDFAYGSVSELPALRVLKAANNRLLEFPHELKNGLDLRSLQILDLGGNDMRKALTADNFAHMESISTLTIPVSTPELITELCHRLGVTLQKVCINSCDLENEDCSTLSELSLDTVSDVPDVDEALDQNGPSEGNDAPEAAVVADVLTPNIDGDPQPDPSASDYAENKKIESDVVDEGVEITATASTGVPSNNPNDVTNDVTSAIPSDVAPAIPTSTTSTILSDVSTAIPSDVTSGIPSDVISPITSEVTSGSVDISTTTEFSLRNAVNNDAAVLNSAVSIRSGLVSMGTADISAQPDSNDASNTNAVNGESVGDTANSAEGEKVGATVMKQGGGIDSSVIAIIVAGMVVVVAGVTIKKNWSSIKNRFRPRPAPGPVSVEAGEIQPNGTSPEEVPLQAKTTA